MHSLTSSSAGSISSVNWDTGQGQYVQPPFHCPLLMESAKKLGLVSGHCRGDQSLTVLCLKALLPSQALEMPELSWHGHSLSLQLSMQGEQAETLFLMWNSSWWVWVTDPSQRLCKEWKNSMHNHIQVKPLEIFALLSAWGTLISEFSTWGDTAEQAGTKGAAINFSHQHMLLREAADRDGCCVNKNPTRVNPEHGFSWTC